MSNKSKSRNYQMPNFLISKGVDPNGYNIPLNIVMRINNQKDDMVDMDDMVSKYDDQESGKYTQNMDDVESGILPEEEDQKLNETVNRFKQIINY